MQRSLTLALAVNLAAVAPATAQVRTIALDLTAPDGANLRATYYSPSAPGPGMLLLHQCNMDRTSWRELASALAERGVHVLTFDYRGYGESAEHTDDRDARAALRAKWPGDIDSAFAVLKRLPGVDAARLAAGGASCGVNNSVQLARRSGEVRALVLLSGNTATDGMAWLQQHPTMPIFGAASAEDGNALPQMRALVATSNHDATAIRELDNAGHGVPMFAVDTTLVPSIADWVAATLRR